MLILQKLSKIHLCPQVFNPCTGDSVTDFWALRHKILFLLIDAKKNKIYIPGQHSPVEACHMHMFTFRITPTIFLNMEIRKKKIV